VFSGYEVWLGNNRGNGYSMRHKVLNPSEPAFWQFTYDEMAQYDLPANINFVLATSGAATLAYVGHSEGTIQAFAGFSANNSIADRVDVFVALAPVRPFASPCAVCAVCVRGVCGMCGLMMIVGGVVVAFRWRTWAT
jgi:predicted alpha/beta hydrolase